MKSLKSFIFESKVDMEKLRNDLSDLMQDWWNNGYDNNRQRKEEFEAFADGDCDMAYDSAISQLADRYNYKEQDLENLDEDDFYDMIAAACQEVLDNN